MLAFYLAYYSRCASGSKPQIEWIGTVDLVFNIALVGAIVAGVWFALQPRYVFLVRVKHGIASVTKGKATPAFLEEIDQACREAALTHGRIGGIRRGKRVILTFSSNIPASLQQRLRNTWLLHG